MAKSPATPRQRGRVAATRVVSAMPKRVIVRCSYTATTPDVQGWVWARPGIASQLIHEYLTAVARGEVAMPAWARETEMDAGLPATGKAAPVEPTPAAAPAVVVAAAAQAPAAPTPVAPVAPVVAPEVRVTAPSAAVAPPRPAEPPAVREPTAASPGATPVPPRAELSQGEQDARGAPEQGIKRATVNSILGNVIAQAKAMQKE